MARAETLLVVFFVAFNLISAFMLSSGIAGMMGLQPEVGEDAAVDERVSNAKDVSSGTGLGETLFGMYNVLAGQLSSFFGAIFPGLRMLERVGVPQSITGGILGPVFSLIIFVGVISFLRGWSL